MKKYPPLLTPLLSGLSLLFAVLACNLSGDTRPPTLVPRPSATPPPTIGYATLAPEEFPMEATQVPQQQRTDAALLNLIAQVEADRLIAHVSALEGFVTRHFNSGGGGPNRGIDAAANYIINQFNQIRDQAYQGNFAVLTQDFPVRWGGINTINKNIVGVLTGTEAGAGIILIGAHYDSISSDVNDNVGFAPGANDNASGVAALIEIARILSQRPQRATVMFVAFGAEEIQRQGSIAFVRDYLLPNNIRIDAMLNMDIIGSSTGPNGQTIDNQIRVYSNDPNDSNSRQLARTLNLIALRHMPDMSIKLEPQADRQGRYSDHITFHEAGFPAVRFIEALENPNLHHTDRDRITTLRPAYLVRATQTVLASAAVLANGPRPPRSISLRDNGNGTRTLVWETTPGAVSYLVALRAPGSVIFNEYFEVNSNSSGAWDGFIPSRYEAVAVAGQDANGMMGPLSAEYAITN
jgi:hypothetical protein